ncbi:MAG: ATP-binding cassette domain-containing protein, partial [Planctomycetota bacterium]|nr:ATP-binding cassette domain-containing protein [Planctomycetota bacterium]
MPTTPAGLEREQTSIETYLNQPARLPPVLRRRIETQWSDEPVQLYALSDLDASLRFAATWIALGPTRLAIATEKKGESPGAIRSFARADVTGVRKAVGLSCTTVTLLGSPDQPPLAEWRFTHRQRRAMENLLFLLEQDLKAREGKAQGRAEPLGRDADSVYAESMAHDMKEAQAAVNANKLAVVWRLMAYLRPYRSRLALGMGAATLLTLISLVPPYLTGRLMDQVVRPYEAGTLASEAARSVAWVLVAGIAAVYIVRELFVWVRLRTLAVLGELVARDIRSQLYEHLQTLSLSYFSGKRTGSLISRVTSDTDRLWEFLAFGVVEVVLSGIMLLGLGAVLIALDWRLGLLMALPVPLLFGAIFLHGESMQRIFLRAWRKWSRVTDVLSDTIPGIRVVKAFNQEDQEKGRFNSRNRDVTEEFNNIHASWTLFWPLLMLGIHLLLIGVWVFGMPRVLGAEGSAPLTSGTFVAFLLYSGMFMGPIEIIGQTARMLNRATSSAQRIFEVLDTRPEACAQTERVKLEPVEGRVTFEHVVFSYDGVRPVLKGVSFDVRPGEMIGLVGPSGAGKTTVTNLIVRFYEPTSGTVRIDGVDLATVDAGHYRRQVGMVLQDPYLFHGTSLE